MTIIIGLAGILIAGICLLLFCVAPGRMPKAAQETARAFSGLNCAHRGLHTKDQSIPENSLAAFAAAHKAGYGVELDVQLSKDGQVLVFHDDTLNRVCGVDARVDALNWEALQKLPLLASEERIPLFSHALKILDDTPIIVELKSAKARNAELCEKTLRILRENGKICCVESFDPRIVAWFRKNAPDVLRGQLSSHPRHFDTLSKLTAYALGSLWTNVLTRPHFIAYRKGARPFAVRACMAMNPMKVVWTVRDEQDAALCEQENDAVIFEYYRPAPRYARGGVG